MYFSGKFVTTKYDNYGFVVSCGEKAVHYMVKEAGYRRGGFVFAGKTVKKYDVGHVDYTSCLNSAVMCEYPVQIWNGTLTTWEYEIFIHNDFLYVFIDGYLCWYVSLTADGFTAGSSYDVGLMRAWSGSKAKFSVEDVRLFSGSRAEKKMEAFLNCKIETFTEIGWNSKAATRYMSDGSIVTLRQEKTVNNQADYNGYYVAWLKAQSAHLYYKATLKINGWSLTFDKGLGFAIAKGTAKHGFDFGGNGMKQWIPSQADATQYVVNSAKMSQITTQSPGARSFTVEYIVNNDTFYMFVDGELTVRIDLTALSGFDGEGEYTIGLLSRWPSPTFEGGYYVPDVKSGAEAVNKIAESGYFA